MSSNRKINENNKEIISERIQANKLVQQNDIVSNNDLIKIEQKENENFNEE